MVSAGRGSLQASREGLPQFVLSRLADVKRLLYADEQGARTQLVRHVEKIVLRPIEEAGKRFYWTIRISPAEEAALLCALVGRNGDTIEIVLLFSMLLLVPMLVRAQAKDDTQERSKMGNVRPTRSRPTQKQGQNKSQPFTRQNSDGHLIGPQPSRASHHPAALLLRPRPSLDIPLQTPKRNVIRKVTCGFP